MISSFGRNLKQWQAKAWTRIPSLRHAEAKVLLIQRCAEFTEDVKADLVHFCTAAFYRRAMVDL